MAQALNLRRCELGRLLVGPSLRKRRHCGRGADGIYAALTSQQERVRELLGARRGDTLLEAFEAERANPPASACS